MYTQACRCTLSTQIEDLVQPLCVHCSHTCHDRIRRQAECRLRIDTYQGPNSIDNGAMQDGIAACCFFPALEEQAIAGTQREGSNLGEGIGPGLRDFNRMSNKGKCQCTES